MQQLGRAAAAAAAQRKTFAQELLSLCYKLGDGHTPRRRHTQSPQHTRCQRGGGSSVLHRTLHWKFTLPTLRTGGKQLLLAAGRFFYACKRLTWEHSHQILQQIACSEWAEYSLSKKASFWANHQVTYDSHPLYQQRSAWAVPTVLAGRASVIIIIILLRTLCLKRYQVEEKTFFIPNQGRTPCSHTKQTKHVRICQRTALPDDSRLKFTLAYLNLHAGHI